MSTGHMPYLVCPKCGAAVAGRLPSGSERRQVECAHCHEKFAFTDPEIQRGFVTYYEREKRWRIARLA